MKLDEKKFYMKIVALNEIYNFLVENIWSHLGVQIIILIFK